MGAQVAKINPLAAMVEGEYQTNKMAADQVGEEARYNAGLRKEEAVKLRKTQQATYAASGVELEGTAAMVIREDEVNANIEAMNMIYAGDYKKAMMRAEARSNRMKGYMELGKTGASLMAGGQ